MNTSVAARCSDYAFIVERAATEGRPYNYGVLLKTFPFHHRQTIESRALL